MNKVVGIDVSKDTLDVVVMEERDQTQYIQVDNTNSGYEKLVRWLKKAQAQGCIVCMEATGRYNEGVAEYLYAAGYRVSVVNPAQIRSYAKAQLRRNKTDKLDAKVIADFGRTQPLQAWSPPPAEYRQLQALVHHLAALEEAKQKLLNRLREQDKLPSLVTDQLHSQRSLLQVQIKQLHQAIQDHIDHFPDLKRQRDLIDSIPGFGPLSAAKLIAECRALAHFNDVRQLVAFAGLNPAHHLSGSSIRKKTIISKMGSSAIRAALYMPAVVAQNHNPILAAFAARLRAKGLCNLAVLAAVMRKLLHLVFGILKSGQPFDPNFAFSA
jgi:transposase